MNGGWLMMQDWKESRKNWNGWLEEGANGIEK